jgi:hypothetical protein
MEAAIPNPAPGATRTTISNPHRATPTEISNPNRAIVDYIGRHGVVTADHVIAALGLSQSTTYRRTAACVEDHLLKRHRFADLGFTLLCATRRGLRYARLPLRPVTVSFPSIDHRLRCASTANLLTNEFDSHQVLSERQLIYAERLADEPVFSARLPDGRLHRPDLAVLTAGRTIVCELELTPKNPRTLEAIIDAWKDATWISEMRYYVTPGPTRRGVERAIHKAHASNRIRILGAPPRKP